MKHDPVCSCENLITVNNDFWPLMAKLKDYPLVKEKGIDDYSDASGNNDINLLITGLNWF